MAEVKQLLSLMIGTLKSSGGHELAAGSSEVSIAIVGHKFGFVGANFIDLVAECFYL